MSINTHAVRIGDAGSGLRRIWMPGREDGSSPGLYMTVDPETLSPVAGRLARLDASTDNTTGVSAVTVESRLTNGELVDRDDPREVEQAERNDRMFVLGEKWSERHPRYRYVWDRYRDGEDLATYLERHARIIDHAGLVVPGDDQQGCSHGARIRPDWRG